ncbi:MAG: ABC transporter permease [Comamonadaceae bacterium]|nr:MAG: ABC transporter permease [Comamonadaceae bacterium]
MSAVLGTTPGAPARGPAWGALLRRQRPLLLAIAVFALVFGGLNLALSAPFGYYDISSTLNNTGTLAIAAMGQTLVIIVGGLDLSAGAVISLANCIFVKGVGTASDPATGALWMAIALLAGCIAGAANGFFIAYMRLQPIVVTLANMFVIQGVTLLVQHEPGGSVSPDYTAVFTGDLIAGVLPASLVTLLALLGLWGLLRRTRFGLALYAIGSDEDAARTNGIRSARVKFTAYVIAGGCYAFAGIFLTAQTGSADPLVGSAMLLPIFVAVLLGGTHMGGGRGGCVGTVFGALTLMLIVNLLLVMKVSAYYGTAAEGALLILAVLGNSVAHGSPLWQHVRVAVARWKQWFGSKRARLNAPPPLRLFAAQSQPRIDSELPSSPWKAWGARNRATLRMILPAYAALLIVLAITAAVLGHRVTPGAYLASVLVLAAMPAVIVLGQGIVILSGGLDMSMPWMVTLAGVMIAGMSQGSDAALLWTVPAVLMIAAAIGAANGIGIAVLGISPIVMTLAMGGILQAAALVYSGGSPVSLVPKALHWMMRGELLGLSPVVWLLAPFVVGATVLLTRTTFGRRLFAVGNGVRAAELSGVPVAGVLIACYAISAVCAACVGLMLSGFGFQATLDMGDAILMPSIAAAVMGGTLITGGRGHYVGMFGGALLLTAMSTLLSGILLPAALRSIIFGGVVLLAVIALRDRSHA